MSENDELPVKAWVHPIYLEFGMEFTPRQIAAAQEPLVLLFDAQRIRDERDRLRKALSTLLDTFERCEAGYPLDVELRFAARDMARAALALAQAEKGDRK